MHAVLEGGFANPVFDSQTAFRAIMDALANPGTPRKLPHTPSTQGPLKADLASILLALSDQDTPVWLAQSLRSEPLSAFIAFHSAAPIVSEPGRAAFALVGHAGELPALDQFNPGTQEYPDRSTTIMLAIEALSGGPERIIRGPGIKDHGHFSPVGLPDDFVAQWAANRELFPRGIDLLLVADGQVIGLPRTTRIAEGH